MENDFDLLKILMTMPPKKRLKLSKANKPNHHHHHPRHQDYQKHYVEAKHLMELAEKHQHESTSGNNAEGSWLTIRNYLHRALHYFNLTSQECVPSLDEIVEEETQKCQELLHQINNSRPNYVHYRIDLPGGLKGFSYYKLLKPILEGGDVGFVKLMEPYIGNDQQAYNFSRFCHVLCHFRQNKPIKLEWQTKLNKPTIHKKMIENLQQILPQLTICPFVVNDLHDREMVFDNGWIVKIGFGLDLYQTVRGISQESSTNIHFDEDHMTTKPTIIDMFHRDELTQHPLFPNYF